MLSKRDFLYIPTQIGFRWIYNEFDYEFTKPSIPAQNVTTALTTLAVLNLLPNEQVIKQCLLGLTVEGRFQKLSDTPKVYTDVAHNPESARYLAQKLNDFKTQGFKVHALLAMLADKDKASVISEVVDLIDHWSCASLSGPRAESASNLRALLPETAPVQLYENVHDALACILPALDEQTILIVFGSFFTVAEAIEYFNK